MAAFIPNQKLPASQLNASLDAKADQSALLTVSVSAAAAVQGVNAINNGTATDAGTLTGAEIATVSRGAGALSTSLTKIATYALQAFLGFTQNGVGAIARSIVAKVLDLPVTMQDFGAKGDGATNDSAAFSAMVAFCAANGRDALLLRGTYLIDPSIVTFTGSLPFKIRGTKGSILKNRNTAASLIYWTGANYAGFDGITIDGSYTGDPSLPVAGGTVVFQNSNGNTLEGVDISNIYRIACLIFNDHQTTLTNVYGGHAINKVRVFGPSNYVAGVGPDAFILADVNNSFITNCYINNIGRFGYELKNDSSNCLIANNVAEDVYSPLYFGGDGAHTELGFVKNSVAHSMVIRRALSGSAINLSTLATNNRVQNIAIDQTGVSGGTQTVYIGGGSSFNSVTGINIEGRSTVATNIVDASNGNLIEIANMNDGAFTGRGNTGIANDCSNNAVVFKNRDSTQQLYLDSYLFNSNSIADVKLGRQILNSASSTTVFNNGGTLVGYIQDTAGFRPQTDVTGQLGASTLRWANVFSLKAVLSGTIALKAPTAVAGASYSQSSTDSTLVFNGTATQTVTLQAASGVAGQFLYVKNTAAFAVNSATSNVVPLAGGAAGTAILAAGPGKWATLQSDGTNWVIIAAN